VRGEGERGGGEGEGRGRGESERGGREGMESATAARTHPNAPGHCILGSPSLHRAWRFRVTRNGAGEMPTRQGTAESKCQGQGSSWLSQRHANPVSGAGLRVQVT
jgi:hypothetical protein